MTGTADTEPYVRLANDRRHVLLDLVLGHDLDPGRPFLGELVRAGGEDLLEIPPVRVDVLGLDYYSHSEWFYDTAGARAPSPFPIGFAAIAEHYGSRYGRPMMLTETNLRGQATDRVTWLRYVLEQYEIALSRGVDLRGLCWFPQIDSCDWDSLLARNAGRVDPVGVVSIDPEDPARRSRSTFTDAWEQVVGGASSADLPAYRWQSPCDVQLRGFTARLDSWRWQEPPAAEEVSAIEVSVTNSGRILVKSTSTQPDLVVLSHLQWPWVWQRPQHLVSRFALQRAATGAQTWFVEEPVADDVDEPALRVQRCDQVWRVQLIVPETDDDPEHIGFDDPRAAGYGPLLREFLRARRRPPAPDLWLYTPMAYDIAQCLSGGRPVYDVMDDLSSFLNAPEGLRLRQRQLLHAADVVFTGGRSLHRSTLMQRRAAVHLFPSGVDSRHYAKSRSMRRPRSHKVAGYVGVIDERVDLDLIARLAAELPRWQVQIVGPVAKIDSSGLPRAENITYLGQVPYERLPATMAGFDVALMPFALNDATRSISPTKTLEYLAAGLPVVSTRVPDVVADYADVVRFADDGPEFARACREVVDQPLGERDRRARPLQARQEWDHIARSMARLLDEHTRTGGEFEDHEATA